MIEGKCNKCGAHYNGSGLNTQSNRMCFVCGNALEVKEKVGNLTYYRFSSMQVEEYKVDAYQEEWENLCNQNLLLNLTLN